MIATGDSSKNKRDKARKEKEEAEEAAKQEASEQAMIDAGRSSRERRKKK